MGLTADFFTVINDYNMPQVHRGDSGDIQIVTIRKIYVVEEKTHANLLV